MGRRRAGRSRGGREGGGQKGGFKAAFAAEVVHEIEALIAPGAADRLDFEAVETAARRRALEVAARAVEQRLNADHSEECAAGFCPRDAALGVQGASLSPGVTRMVGQVGAMVSFEEGHELLRELAGVDVATKHVERAAEALGREIARDERCVVEPPPPDEPVAPTLYLGLDGTGVPMRPSELEGRPGKQPDGSAKTREVKLCTVWSAEGRDEEGTPVRDAGSVTYSAAIESAASKDTDDD